MKKVLFFWAALQIAVSLTAAVKPATIFNDHMVLQRNTEVPVWGTAKANETVTVSFNGQTISTRASAKGTWQIKLKPMQADSRPQDLVIKGEKNSVTIKDILVGEVWLCSGQSNMEMSLWSNNPYWRAFDGNKDAKAGANPLIRVSYCTPHAWGPLPDPTYAIKWQVLEEHNGLSFPATAFYFGQFIFKGLKNVPIGILVSCWSGSMIEPWIPPSGYDSVPELAATARNVNAKLPGTAEYKKINQKTIETYTKWLEDFRKASENGKLQPELPPYPSELRHHKHSMSPTVIYNRMIYPMVPFAFRGVIWYQGCSNLHDGANYYHKMKALLQGWRKEFLQPEMPFYFVQLAPFNYGGDPERLPIIWETQEKFARDHGNSVGMAVINDTGELQNIHPGDKKNVGKRLALLALKYTYGQKDLKADSPELVSWKVENGKFILDFKHVENWVSKGEVTNFEVSGASGRWVPAKLEIRGKQLAVSSKEVPKPSQLRYMWRQTAIGNLFNEAGLPLGAFRCGAPPTRSAVLEDLNHAWKLVYKHDMKRATDKDGGIEYLIDNSDRFLTQKIKRIAYFAELVTKDGKEQWLLVTMDPFTQEIKKIGVPVWKSKAFFATFVKNLHLTTNVSGVANGPLNQGYIEFWGCSYSPNNRHGIHKASGKVYDWGDDALPRHPVGYGSMQIHNYQSQQTIFAYNNFRSHINDIGIGNAPGKNTDWTFSGSSIKLAKAVLWVFADL